MLRITIEVFPFGSVRRSKTIKTMLIINSGTGTDLKGDYVVEFYDEGGEPSGSVEVKKFQKSLGPWCLLYKALDKLWGKKK